ncbi:MAG: hypothetical protein KatS3mg077_1945 [Candidatus Binatia bacterium]|nr:MAG: hypothetical protein KatS3mg077_1945 [Candidatus Binatia bacterium]
MPRFLPEVGVATSQLANASHTGKTHSGPTRVLKLPEGNPWKKSLSLALRRTQSGREPSSHGQSANIAYTPAGGAPRR